MIIIIKLKVCHYQMEERTHAWGLYNKGSLWPDSRCCLALHVLTSVGLDLDS